MKTASVLKIGIALITTTTFVQPIFADDLSSPNYKVVGATTSTGGGLVDSVSGSYSVMNSVGNIAADPRNYSSNYRLQQDPSSNFLAAQPSVKCFETTTSGSSSCTTGPSALTTGGMVAICGAGGCYDKARFEINSNGNPSDTLYSIAISTDGFVNDTKYIDGATFKPESATNHDINDFRTLSYWEAETFNIKGLNANTTYNIKITALKGDFTQSDYSKTANTTTSTGTIFFDIDIASSSGSTTDTNPPYTITFSSLVAGAAPTKSTSLIWLDIDSNSSGGVAVLTYGKYAGLYSSTTAQTITSANADLNSTSEGFGLQSYYVANDTSVYFGNLSATSNYSGSINTVGAVSQTANKIYDGNGPIQNGRVGMYLIAKAGTDKTPANDYSDDLYFILVPRY